MKTRTALLSLLSLVSQLNAQTTTVSCDQNEAILTNIGPGGTATFEFLVPPGDGPLLISYSACNSDAVVGPVSIDVVDINAASTITSCDSAALPCVGGDGLCFADLPDGEYEFVVSTSPAGATGDVQLSLNCSASTLEPTANPTTAAPTTATPTTASPTTASPTTGTPTTLAPAITPTTESPTESLSTMESTMSSTDSESFDSSSFDSESPESSESGSISLPGSGSGSDDDESGSDDSDDSDESGDVVDLGDLEDDEESDDAQGGNSRVDNVFEARGKTGQATTEDMIWKYMWGVVGLFGAINVAICYCMFKNRKRAEVSFTKVEVGDEHDVL